MKSRLSESEKSPEQSNSSQRSIAVKKVSPKVRNRNESTANQNKKKLGNPTESIVISDDDSDLDEDDKSLVRLLNRRNVHDDDENSITPSHSASCTVAPAKKEAKNKINQSRVLRPVQNNSPPASTFCGSDFDNDSIAPIRRKKNSEQLQIPGPSTSRAQHTPVAVRRPEKRKSESEPRTPHKRRPWDPDEDRRLTEGFIKFRNSKFIWTLIKNKYFANSTRTNVNLKDRARTLGLK